MANGNGRRRTDVTRLSFPLQLVGVIVVSALTAMGSAYAMRDRLVVDQQMLAADQQKIASDVRDILTRMEAAVKIQEAQAKLADQRAAAIDAAISELKREQRLLDVNLRAANESLILLKGRTK